MARTQDKLIIRGVEEKEITEKIVKRRVLFFFNVESRVFESETSFGNDIEIITDRPIRNVYLNGKLLNY